MWIHLVVVGVVGFIGFDWVHSDTPGCRRVHSGFVWIPSRVSTDRRDHSVSRGFTDSGRRVHSESRSFPRARILVVGLIVIRVGSLGPS